MTSSIQTIPVLNLSIAFLPVLIVLAIYYKWSLEVKTGFYAVFRMILQLFLIGYFLTYIFEAKNAWLVMLVLVVMLLLSSWIALRSIKTHRLKLYKYTLLAIGLGGGLVLLIISQAVLELNPWFLPKYLIPLAGMIFANSMNSVSLAAERFFAEIEAKRDYPSARKIAFNAALIPVVNSLFAVGLVSIPGMMTGQILSGVSPFIAARYQIMVMCMIFGSAGISSACFLMLIKQNYKVITED